MPLRWGRVFAIASALTPVFLGVCLGALGAAAAVFVAAGGTLALAPASAPLVGRGLSASAWALPLHIATG
jgi:hypothetical protein